MKKFSQAFALIFCFLSLTLFAHENPVELGAVTWNRDMDMARQMAKETDKPILILFQEVPGCMTCQRYGNLVLSHPLIVETIETYFVPLAIYNNKGGKDREVLNFFNEPTWNNPVVRIVDADRKNLLPRLNADYSPAGLVSYMIRALNLEDVPIPSYLQLLEEELQAMERGTARATLSMYCFWTGEKELGSISGVVATEPGFMDHREVVNVFYDPQVTGLDKILEHGAATDCADAAYLADAQQRQEAAGVLGDQQVHRAQSFRPDREPKYYMSKTPYRFIPMSPMQAMRVNSSLGQGRRPDKILSPRQWAMLNFLQKHQPKWNSVIHSEDWMEQFHQRWEETQSRS